MFRFPNLCTLACALCGQAAPFVYPRRSAFSWPVFSASAARGHAYSRAFYTAFLLLAGLAIPGLAQTATPSATFLSFHAAQIGVSGGSAQTLTASFAVSGYAGSFTPTATLHYGQDYTLGAVSCTGGASETCTVPVTFQPTLPGSRKDAIFLMNGSARLATVLLNGVGQGPMSLVQPGAFTTSVPSSSLSTSGYNYIYQSVADENGTVYLLPSGNANFIVSVTKAGVTTLIPLTHPLYFWTIGIDGAGVLYLFGESAKVLTYDTVQGIQGVYNIPNPGTDTDWYPGVVSGDGSIYVVDEGRSSDTADEFKPDGSGGYAYTISPSINQVFTAALDSAGNVFFGGYTINEITAAGVQTQVNTVGASDGLAVDAADTLYATRYSPTNGVAELPASNYSTAIASIDAHSSPLGVSVGSDGTVYVSNYVNLDVFNRSTTETIDFGQVSSTQSKTDSTASIYNGGNVPLTISEFTLTGAGFSIDSTQPDDCISGMVLNPGALCLVTTTFTPGHAGVFSGTITIESNSLNQTNLQQSILLTGTSDGSYDVLNPNPLTFPSQAVGTNATQPVTMTNQGSYYSSTIYSINVDNPAFTVSYATCATATGPGASCQLQVSFKPTTATSYAGTATIITYVSGTSLPSQTLTLTLDGSGTGPIAATPVIAPGTGSYSLSQQVTITDATAGATIYYTTDGSAPTSASSTYTSAITISSNETLNAMATATGYSQSATATATYTFVYPAVTFTPASVAFGNQTVNTTSGSQTVTLTNSGAAALAITSIALTGTNASSFAQTNTCGATLAACASCNIAITFVPTTVASYSAALAVTDNASGSPHTVALSGSGTAAPAPVAVLTPASLSFGSVGVGGTSPAQSATLKNTGTAALSITSNAITGANPADFAQTNTCGASLAAGASCVVSITFTPASVAIFSATVTVTDNATGSPHLVALTGTGIVEPPIFTLSPTSLAFGNQVVNTTKSQTITLTNTSATDTVTISNETSTDPAFFDAADNCHASIAPGASCHFLIAFNPKTLASFSATITLQVGGVSCAACSYPSQTFAVTGTGTPEFTISPASLDFGNQIVGTTSAAKTVYFSNNSNDIITVQSVTSSDPAFANFALVDGCELGLQPGINPNCSFRVTFSPTAVQPYSATLTVQARDISNPGVTFPTQTITVTGTGIASPPAFAVSAASIAFGNQIVNTKSANSTVTLTNTTSDIIKVQAISSSDPAFAINASVSGCEIGLTPGVNCSFWATFSPTAIQPYSATLTVQAHDISNPAVTFPPQTITVTGTGIAQPPAFAISPTLVAFGNQIVGVTSANSTVTLTNTTGDIIKVQSITSSDPAFATNADVSGCELGLTPGVNCSLWVTFSPTAVQPYSVTLTVQVHDISNPAVTFPSQTITVTGTGTGNVPQIDIGSPIMIFSTTEFTTSAPQTVMISNSGSGPLLISGISLSGSNPNDYKESDNCGLSLAVGASCTISVTFTPPSVGSYPATVVIDDNDPSSPQTITLNGTGVNLPDFVVASSIPSLAVPPGGSAQFSITVSAQNGAIIPAVTLSATGLPPGATASFTQSSITPGSTSATTTLAIHTQQTLAGNRDSTPAGTIAALPSLALLGWFFVPRMQRRRWITVALLLFASLGGVSALTGCAGGFNLIPPAKTYTVTVTATIGAVQQATTVQLTVE